MRKLCGLEPRESTVLSNGRVGVYNVCLYPMVYVRDITPCNPLNLGVPGSNGLNKHTGPSDYYSVGERVVLLTLHRKKRFTSFPSPAGMSLTKLPLGRNNSVMTTLFPPWFSLVVTSRLGTGNSWTFFYGVSSKQVRSQWTYVHLHSETLQDFIISSFGKKKDWGFLVDLFF